MRAFLWPAFAVAGCVAALVGCGQDHAFEKPLTPVTVQIADVPGRGQPGSGGLDWAAQLGVLRASGYAGPIGLEYFPTVASEESVRLIREVAATA